MSKVFRFICGAVGVAMLVGTAVFALQLLAMERDMSVLVAAYMAIGGILVGVYLLIYAITGNWQPTPSRRKTPQ